MRDDGWDNLINKVVDFCGKYKIEVPVMNVAYIPQGRSKRFASECTNLYHYHIDVFLAVIDLQLQEFNNQFNETNMELLSCMACLSLAKSFDAFDKQKVLKLTKFYPNDFTNLELISFNYHLDNFIIDMREDNRFSDLEDLVQLSMKLVETSKHLIYVEIYKFLKLVLVSCLCLNKKKLVLVLLVATIGVERTFSAMTFIKNKLSNRMGDDF